MEQQLLRTISTIGFFFNNNSKECFFEKIKKQIKDQKIQQQKKQETYFHLECFQNIQRQLKFEQDILKDAVVLQQHKQNKYPFSNSVILRIQTKKQNGFSSLGSGVIVTIGQKKYIATVCHNFYKFPKWFQVIAFLKQQNLLNSLRKPITICKQQLKYNQKFLQKMQQNHEIAFVEIQTYNFIQKNYDIQIHFDWNINSKDQVYFMAFPYDYNSTRININDFQSSSMLNLIFRKIHVQKQKNMFILYKNPTEQGESGGALMIQKNGIFYLIGLHIGGFPKNNNKEGKEQLQKKQQQSGYNIGILFKRNQLNLTFPNIFLKRNRPSDGSNINEKEQNDNNVQRMSKMRLTQNPENGQTRDSYMSFPIINRRIFYNTCGKLTNCYLFRNIFYQSYQCRKKNGPCGFSINEKKFYLCITCFNKQKN